MGKKGKIGKQRKDKFYQLAKETGYRSRAAFKLIQLNRKYEFLQKSRVCIDLCAAPGGWMQVARQNMPVSSIVIGVDLFPIKPIPGSISLVEDITTDKCKASISKEIKTWKADVVLNDGAPNVGTNWIHDAFQQSLLTLSAVKLASHFLRRGGWFVTKIFRSKDYNSLLWVLQQLFKKVHATKPQASRSESAEIFVVCQYYIAPDKVDPKFFDAKYVFSELDVTNQINILHPERNKKPKPQGYPENDYTLFHTLSAAKFIEHSTAIELLQDASAIVIDDPRIAEHPKTTQEIKECCKDIKVLNRKDVKLLLSWWKGLHHEFYKKDEIEESKNDNDKTDPSIEDENDSEKEEAKIDEAIAELKEEKRKELKKKKKKAQKERAKLNERMSLKMIHKGDTGPQMEDTDIFSIKGIKTLEILEKITDQNPDVLAESESEAEETDKVKVSKKVLYKKDKGHLDSSGTFYKSDSDSEAGSDNEDEDLEDTELEFSNDDEDYEANKEDQSIYDNLHDTSINYVEEDNPLVTDLDFNNKSSKKINKARLWFEKEAFKNLERESDEEYELDKMAEVYKNKGNKVGSDESKESNEMKDKSKIINGMQKKGEEDDDDEDSDSNSDSDSDYNVEEEFLTDKKQKSTKESNKPETKNEETSTLNKKKGKRKLKDEELALGTLLIKSKKSRRDIADAGWNRYAFNDDRLPDWFVQDEQKHMKVKAPVSEELVDEYKKAVIDINARPIKKVIEAKARKKKRALRKLEKARKKVETLMDNEDITDREKADQIKKLYKQAKRQPKKEVTYVVSKKHLAQKRASRPPGIKGRYRVVDARMKKELRAHKKQISAQNKGKKGKRGVGLRKNNRSKSKTSSNRRKPKK